MQLVPGEKILMESDGKQLVLTTQRIRFRAQGRGSAHIFSILLSELSCCELSYKSYPLLLLVTVLSIFAVIAGYANHSDEMVVVGFIGAIVFTLAYFLTRRQVLSLASSGGRVEVVATGIGLEAVLGFIEEAEAAKLCLALLPPLQMELARSRAPEVAAPA